MHRYLKHRKEMSSTPCPICANPDAVELPRTGSALRCKCPRCGQYSITGTAVSIWSASEATPQQMANASGWIREHPDVTIGSDDIAVIRGLTTPNVAQRANQLFAAIAKGSPAIGQRTGFHYGDTEFLGVSWSTAPSEVEYLVESYLQNEMKFVASDQGHIDAFVGHITPLGHHHLEEAKHGSAFSNIGFCAMWFGEEVKPVWTMAIQPAIRDAGYESMRIDSHEHNNRIDDEILAMLRRSKFVVADFTGQRGGVYFEAGFALGLGLPVVWTCSKQALSEIHFDNRQYAFVTWEFDQLADFKTRLQNRIEAIIGQGLTLGK